MKPDFTEIEFHEYFSTMASGDMAFLKKYIYIYIF